MSVCTRLQIFSLAWSPDGRHLATVCKDGYLRVYEPRRDPEPLQVSGVHWGRPPDLSEGRLSGLTCCIPTGRPRA